MQNRLFNLLRDNKGSGFLRAETVGDETTIYIHDVIVSDSFWGGVSSTDIISELTKVKSGTIHLRINSPGGDVFAARAIEQAIKEHTANIIAHVDGYAASAASYVAIAANSVVMAKGAFMMIHKAWSMVMGNEHEFIKIAGLLGKIDGSLVETYAEKTGQAPEKITQWMAEETWFTAQEAVDFGFADSISEAKNTGTKAKWNMAAYDHAPKITDEVDEKVIINDEEIIINLDHLKRKLDLIQRIA